MLADPYLDVHITVQEQLELGFRPGLFSAHTEPDMDSLAPKAGGMGGRIPPVEQLAGDVPQKL